MEQLNDQYQKTNKKLRFLSVILFIITFVVGLWLIYEMSADLHQGEFCHLKNNSETYQFMLHGRRCDLNWLGLYEPFIFFISMHIVSQAIFWIFCKPVFVLFLFHKLSKENNQDLDYPSEETSG